MSRLRGVVDENNEENEWEYRPTTTAKRVLCCGCNNTVRVVTNIIAGMRTEALYPNISFTFTIQLATRTFLLYMTRIFLSRDFGALRHE